MSSESKLPEEESMGENPVWTGLNYFKGLIIVLSFLLPEKPLD
jgi:hypothetical protein